MDLLAARIPPVLEEVDVLGSRLRDAAAPFLAEDRLFAFEIALVEALTNIIRHGGLSAEDAVEVRLSETAGVVELEIRDTGPAPPADLFTAPRPDSDPMAESGRGIALILSCADAVRLSRDGKVNRLVLRFGAAG